MILRLVWIAITSLMAVAVIGALVAIASRWNLWRRSRRMGTALIPIGVRLIPLSGLASPALERLATGLMETGFREVGRYATDRAPHATVIAFVSPDARTYGGVTEHPTMGVYIEITRNDGGAVVTATNARLPTGARTRPGTRIVSRPRANVAELLAIVERESADFAPHAHTAEAFVRDWEGIYRRGMTWAYSEGPLRNSDPDLQARLTGLPVDEETAYFLRVRREGATPG